MISSLGFVTGFTDSELNHVHGYAIVKQNDLKVIIGGFLNDKLHGYCLTYMNGKIESLQHYEEGNKIDSIIVHKENYSLPDDSAPFHEPFCSKGHLYEKIKRDDYRQYNVCEKCDK